MKSRWEVVGKVDSPIGFVYLPKNAEKILLEELGDGGIIYHAC